MNSPGSLLDQIRVLENQSDSERFNQIIHWLQQWDIAPEVHEYATGRNIIIPSGKERRIGLGAHFDTVPGSPGANDNGSAIVVALEITRRLQQQPLGNPGVDVFIFDEEETGLLGSKAYLRQYGLNGMEAFLNLEMVGMGKHFALWPLNQRYRGHLLQTFEQTATNRGIINQRFDRILNTADHASFMAHGLNDCFSLTVISDGDIEAAQHYYKAMEFAVDDQTLYEILLKAPLFEHYHQSSDRSAHLSEQTLQMTVDTIWETFVNFQV
ncbi:MAG: M28 family peptidase [Bacteroidota bacterium]